MPVNTFRAWFLGILFTVILNFVDQFLYYRYPSVRISALVVQLVTLPLGKLMARTLPTKEWQTPFGPFSLNPGPFNSKEHTLITLMANGKCSRACSMNFSFNLSDTTYWNLETTGIGRSIVSAVQLAHNFFSSLPSMTLLYLLPTPVYRKPVTYQGAYATDILAAQKFFYGQETSWNYSILIVMS